MKKILIKAVKKVAFFAMGISVLVLTSCGGDPKEQLNVYNWGDYIDESVLEQFEDETGIEVVYETFGNNEELLSKIESATTNYDVLFPSDYMVKIMANKGLLSEIDMTKISNYDQIDPRFKGLSYDPDEKYSIPYMWQTVGIAYNKEEVDAEKVKSWDVLWDDEYKGDIIMLDSPRDSIGTALKKLGYSLNSTNAKELEEAKQLLIDQKSLVNSYQVDYYKTALIGEEALMSLAWSGDAMLIADENPKFSYSIPKEGTNVCLDCMVIPEQSDNKEAAHKFIEFMNRPEIALKNSEYIMYSTPNVETMKLLGDVAKDPLYYPTGSIDEIGEIFVDLGAEYNQIYDEIWTEVKSAPVN